MREDIAAIEARNNNLELQTRNSSKLLASLDGELWDHAVPGRTCSQAIHLGAAAMRALCIQQGGQCISHLAMGAYRS